MELDGKSLSPRDDAAEAPTLRASASIEDGIAAPKASSDPPDGGLQAWLQVAGSWSLFFNSWGLVNSFGVFQTYYRIELLASESPSNIAWIGSIQACLLLVIGPLVGPLFDAGYGLVLIRIGSFMIVFGMMMTSLATEYYQVLLAQGICVGMGAGFLFIPSVAVLATYFSTKKATAMGFASTGSSIAGIVLPIIFSQLQPRIGFPWTTRIMGFISLGTLSVPLLVMRPRVQQMAKRPLIDLSALSEPAFVLFAFAVFFGFIGLYIPFFYIPTYALSVDPEHITPAFSLYLLAILNGASVPGRIFPNFVADRIGPITVMSGAALLTCVFAFGWFGVGERSSIIAFCALYGFSTGAFVSLPPACITNLSPHLGIVGTRMGMTFFMSGTGVLLGSPIAGAILRSQGGNTWWGVKTFGSCFALACAISLCLCRGFKTNWRLWSKA